MRIVLRYVLFTFLIASPVWIVHQSLAQGAPTFVINLRDTALEAFSEQVSEITGRTIILDPGARGKVTVISTEPLSADAVWDLYQSVLRSSGFAAIRTGQVWRVAPQAKIGQSAQGDGFGGSQDLVTVLVHLNTLPSADAMRVLRPMVASFGVLEALTKPNALIVTDTGENVQRIMELARSLDKRPAQQTQSLTLRFANARETGQLLRQILQAGGQGERGPLIAVDERSNTLLIRGRSDEVVDAIFLAESLDTPSGTKPTTRVFRLRNSDAETVAEILKGLVGTAPTATNPVAQALSTPSPDQSEPSVVSNAPAGGLAIQTSPELNAIIVRGSPAAISDADRLISELDVRRPQVLIEAAIVEVSGDTAEQLGIQFGAGSAVPQQSFAATSFSLTGLSLRAILAAVGGPAASIATEGFSAGININDNFGILIQALAQSSKANLLSTPSLTTLDNQAAEIVVAQNVPFLTGSFSPSGASNDVFSTIERKDVGIILRVVPRVHEGDTVRLEVSQEVSSLVNANIQGAVDLITNRRSIQTTILADNGGTIVLGGLITDDRQSTDSKIPVLGDVPVVGRLFRADQERRTKRTLFVFLRPTILRDRSAVETASQARYSRLRDAAAAPISVGSLLFDEPVQALPVEIQGLY